MAHRLRTTVAVSKKHKSVLAPAYRRLSSPDQVGAWSDVGRFASRALKTRFNIMMTKISLLTTALIVSRLSAFATDTPPNIIQSPVSQIVSAGASVTLYVTATGTSLQYQWTYK